MKIGTKNFSILIGCLAVAFAGMLLFVDWVAAQQNYPTYSTDRSTANLSGTATGEVAIVRVSWTNDRGGSGDAVGTSSWSISGIVLQSGQNTIVITALDTNGNSTSGGVIINYTPASPTPTPTPTLTPTPTPTPTVSPSPTPSVSPSPSPSSSPTPTPTPTPTVTPTPTATPSATPASSPTPTPIVVNLGGGGGGGGGSRVSPTLVATTTASLSASDSLLEQIIRIIIAMLNGRHSPVSQLTPITRQLKYGFSPEGEDIRSLQIVLNREGFTIAASGPGSPGQETTRYGPATRDAVLKFQIAKGVEGPNGIVGPQTRDLINALMRR